MNIIRQHDFKLSMFYSIIKNKQESSDINSCKINIKNKFKMADNCLQEHF